MGIFDDFGINPEDIQEAGNFDIEDGTYRFEVAEAEVQSGTKNNPDDTFFYIDYQLFDEAGDPVGSSRSWYTLAQDGDSETKRVVQSMSFFKADLRRLGVTDLANFDGSEIVGKTGVLQLKSTQGKGANRDKTYQNIRNLRLDEEEAPAPKKAAKKVAPKKSAPKIEEPEDEDDNPFGNE